MMSLNHTVGIRGYWLAGALVLFLLFGTASAAEWVPSERITLVTHSSPGAGNEQMLREIADIWNKNQFVPKLVSVESVTGAQGENLRRHVIHKNKGNPHVLAAYTPPSLNNPLLMDTDTGWRKFTPIARMAYQEMVLVVNSKSPYKSLKDLVEAAKNKPGSVLQGGGNYGNSASMTGKLLEEAAGVSFTYTPFKGGGDAVLALLGNHVQMIIENPSEVLQHVQAGNLKVLAAGNRLEIFPGVPTFVEAGYNVKDLAPFIALMAPPEIPSESARFYVQLLDRTRGMQRWKDYLVKASLTDGWLPGEELKAYFEEEEKVYARLSKEMGLLKKNSKK